MFCEGYRGLGRRPHKTACVAQLLFARLLDEESSGERQFEAHLSSVVGNRSPSLLASLLDLSGCDASKGKSCTRLPSLLLFLQKTKDFWYIGICLAMSSHDSTHELYQVVACRDSVSQGPCLTLLSGSRAAAR